MNHSLDIENDFKQHRLVPVIALEQAGHAQGLAESLVAGGLPIAEVTFRTEAAEESIAIMAQNRDLLVGAGTVLTIEQVDRSRKAGAQFVVAPGLNPRVVKHCQAIEMPVFPGVCTPTEIEQALELGIETVKFFPAEAYGGVKTLQALAGPYRHVRFLPTGGINLSNLDSYLACSSVIACGGSWMVKPSLYESGSFDQVERLAHEATQFVKSLETQKG